MLPPAFREVVTQQEAHDAYNLPDARILGPPATDPHQPTTGVSKVTTLRGMRVVVKRIGEPRRRAPLELRHAYNIFFKTEARNHLQAYVNLPPACREFLSIPACMEMDASKLVGSYPYTVQTFLEMPGHRLLTAWDFFAYHTDPNDPTLRRLDNSVIQSICEGFGRMIGCMYRSKIRHADLHQDNVLLLVPDAFAEFVLDYRVNKTLDFGALHGHTDVKWRMIDWGESEALNPVVPLQLCKATDPKQVSNGQTTDTELQLWGVLGASGKSCQIVRETCMSLIRKAMASPPDGRHPPSKLRAPKPTEKQLVDWVNAAIVTELAALGRELTRA